MPLRHWFLAEVQNRQPNDDLNDDVNSLTFAQQQKINEKNSSFKKAKLVNAFL